MGLGVKPVRFGLVQGRFSVNRTNSVRGQHRIETDSKEIGTVLFGLSRFSGRFGSAQRGREEHGLIDRDETILQI